MMRRTTIRALLALSLATASGAAAAPGDPPRRPQPARPQPQPVRPQPQPVPVPVQPQPMQPQRPPVSTAARQARAIPYVRTTTRTVWPAGSTRRQLVISGGWRGERYAWLIADGTRFVAVYRAGTRAELDELVEKFIHEMVFETVGSPTDKTEWGIAGAIKVPLPPPPPEPGGFPWDYVDTVMAAAWRLDTQVLQPQQALKAPVATPATPATPAKR